MNTTAIFPGSFDPFTIGHYDIAQRALALADHLVIAVGVNEHKHYTQSTEERLKAIATLYADNPRVEVVAYSDLTTEQADINRLVSGLETIILFAKPELACVSSTMVRELSHFGQDTTPFLPKRKQE